MSKPALVEYIYEVKPPIEILPIATDAVESTYPMIAPKMLFNPAYISIVVIWLSYKFSSASLYNIPRNPPNTSVATNVVSSIITLDTYSYDC